MRYMQSLGSSTRLGLSVINLFQTPWWIKHRSFIVTERYQVSVPSLQGGLRMGMDFRAKSPPALWIRLQEMMDIRGYG